MVACFVVAREAEAVFDVVGELHGAVEAGALVAVLCGCPSDAWGKAQLLGQGAAWVWAREEVVCPGIGSAPWWGRCCLGRVFAEGAICSEGGLDALLLGCGFGGDSVASALLLFAVCDAGGDDTLDANGSVT